MNLADALNKLEITPVDEIGMLVVEKIKLKMESERLTVSKDGESAVWNGTEWEQNG